MKLDVDEIVKAVAEAAGISGEQARKAVATVMKYFEISDDLDPKKKAAIAATAATTATLVPTVFHKP